MRILALDCGGTKTRGILVEDGVLVCERDLPPINLQSEGPTAAARLLAGAASSFPDARAVACSLAGLRTEQDRDLVVQALGQAGFDLPVLLFPDALAALRAGGLQAGVALIVGTGSAAYARGPDGSEARAGGWGHRLGDEGSGYWMGREALSAVVRAHDSNSSSGQCLRLEQAVLAHFGLGHVDALRPIAGGPTAVQQIAGLTPVLARLYREQESVSRDIVVRAADELARLVSAVADRVPLPAPRPIMMAGGVNRALPELRELVAGKLGRGYEVSLLSADPAWGAYWLAVESSAWLRPEAQRLPITERENPRSEGFARLSILEQAALMNAEDARVAPSVAGALPEIARLVDAVVDRLAAGGRLIYVGAGTSGRLAMQDAVECVPTFGLPPGQIVALMAGGRAALEKAVEGAEDDAAAGERDLLAFEPVNRDVVVGVTASGRARYVRRALEVAHEKGCLTGVIICNSAAPLGRLVDIRIVVEPGPEVIAGSTRLKAGTAQKMVLNMISTLSMVRLGRTLGTRMIGVQPTNAKLRMRSIRLVSGLTFCSESEAEAALNRTGWDVPLAALSLHLGGVEAARERLTECGMNISEAFSRSGLPPP